MVAPIWRFQPAEPLTRANASTTAKVSCHVQAAAAVALGKQHAQQAAGAKGLDGLVAEPAVDLGLLGVGLHDVGDVGDAREVVGLVARCSRHAGDVTAFSG